MVKFSLLATAAFIAPALGLIFNLDCTDCPKSCNNDCYAVNVAGKGGGPLYYDKKGSTDRRKASGCTMSRNGKSVCGDTGNDHYRKSGNTCDEFPYASVEQGGKGSILRCVPNDDNKDEGTQLGAFYRRKDGGCGGDKCHYGITISHYQSSPYCKDASLKKNDGFEFKLKDGKYVDAKRKRGDEAEDFYESHEANSTVFFAPELRREFLLSNGEKVLYLSRDLDIDLIGETVGNGFENEPSAIIVQELFGDEKSEPFRPRKK